VVSAAARAGLKEILTRIPVVCSYLIVDGVAGST